MCTFFNSRSRLFARAATDKGEKVLLGEGGFDVDDERGEMHATCAWRVRQSANGDNLGMLLGGST